MSKQFLAAGFLLLSLGGWSPTQAQGTFTSLEAFLAYATTQSKTLQAGGIRLDQAKKAKLAALMGVVDPTVNTLANYTNNTQLQVSLFPAEILGGQPGTFREVPLGQQYTTNLNAGAELRLLNLAGWANLKVSKLNIQATHSDNLLNRKSFSEDVAAIYFNIISLHTQQKATEQNKVLADSLQLTVERKFAQGLVKPQDVNSAKANALNAAEAAKQAEFLLAQQYLALKTLCDIPENETIAIEQVPSEADLEQVPSIALNPLAVENSRWHEQKALASYQQVKLAQVPTIAFFASLTRQQFNTEPALFASNVRWIPSSYIGVKLVWSSPSANTLSQLFKAKYDYRLAQQNTAKVELQAGLQAQKLNVDHAKAVSQWKTNRQVYELNRDTYQKNLNLYRDGILSLDQTLTSFNTMTNSEYNLISSSVNILLAKSKIYLNNLEK